MNKKDCCVKCGNLIKIQTFNGEKKQEKINTAIWD